MCSVPRNQDMSAKLVITSLLKGCSVSSFDACLSHSKGLESNSWSWSESKWYPSIMSMMGKMSSSGYQQDLAIYFECLPFVFDFKHIRTGSSSVHMTVLVVSPLVSLSLIKLRASGSMVFLLQFLVATRVWREVYWLRRKTCQYLASTACCLHPLKPLLELRGGRKNLYSHHFLIRLL